MFGLGRKHEEPSPKDEPVSTAIEERLAELNRLRDAQHRYKRDGSHITTKVILDDQQSTLWRELVDEYEVLPIHDERTGRWILFGRH